MTSLRQRMLEDMQIRNLAVNTQESYVQQISLFARYFNRKRVSNPPSQGAEPVLKCGYGSSDERSHGKTTDAGRDSADCGGVCKEWHATG